MRSLTTTLLAAQRALGAKPAVRLRVQDREVRWSCLLDDDTSSCLTAGCTVAGGLLRIRIGPAGALDVQRLADPADPGGWQLWAPLTADAAPAGDVALSALADNPACVRLFYVRGAGPFSLAWLQSDDSGCTWSGPWELQGGLATPAFSLASANGQLFYHDPADGCLKLARRASWEGGTWDVSTWSAAGPLPARHGLAAGYRAGVYYLATADEETPSVRRLRTGAYTVAAGAWSEPVAIVPPGLPAAAFWPAHPSLLDDAGLWRLAYLESYAGVLVYADPTLIASPDWEHWSFACGVPLPGYSAAPRAVLLAHAGVLYLAQEKAAWQAPSYTAAHTDQNLETDRVLAYTLSEGPGAARACIEVHNPAGRYRQLGVAGTPGAALRPLARVQLERGYRTPAGEERLAYAPLYLLTAALRQEGGQSTLCLECAGGWELLRRWQPEAPHTWTNKSVGWLIAEIVCRAAGLSCAFDGHPGWEQVLPTFVLVPGNWPDALPGQGEGTPGPAAAAVRVLLAGVCGAARWREDGALYCFVPTAEAAGEPHAIGSAGEVLAAEYGLGLIWPNQARVFGKDAASQAQASTAPGAPRRYLATQVDAALGTAEACAERALGLAAQGQARAVSAWVETPCQPGIELYDLVTPTDPRAPYAPGAILRVIAIAERYEPARGRFVTRLTLEGT